MRIIIKYAAPELDDSRKPVNGNVEANTARE